MRGWRWYWKVALGVAVGMGMAAAFVLVFPRYRVHDTRVATRLTAVMPGKPNRRNPFSEAEAAREAAREPTYVARARCTNCGWGGRIRVPSGERVNSVLCPRCEVWPSTLVSREMWEVLKAKAGSAH